MRTLVLLLLICLAVGITNAKRGRNQDRTQSIRDQDQVGGESIIIENKGKIGVTRENEQLQLGDQNILNRLGYTQNIGKLQTTDMETLLKQKFLLEVLFNVNGVLINKELQELGETLVLDEQQYVGGMDTEMLQLLELCINNQMLNKKDTFNALNPAHVKQMLGLYKLLLRAIDWSTFQKNVCFARMHFNGELFVNAILLAAAERSDTIGLIIPGIHEILPELYYDKQLLQRASTIDIDNLLIDKITLKPQILDIIQPYQRGSGMQAQKTWQAWRQEGVAKQSAGGISPPQNRRWGVMQPQTWTTWQQRRQERLEKLAKLEKLKPNEGVELGKLVLPVLDLNNAGSSNLDEAISYLTNDIGLNNFWYSFNIDSLRKINLQIPAITETTKVENIKQLSGIDKSDLKTPKLGADLTNTNRPLFANRRRLVEERRVTQNIFESDARSPKVIQNNRRIVNSQENVNKEVNNIKLMKPEVRDSVATSLRLFENIMNKDSSKAPIERFNVLDRNVGMRSEFVNSLDSTSRLLKVNPRRMNQSLPNGSKQDIEKPTTSDLNAATKDGKNERLLRINRRRLNQDTSRIQNEQERQSSIGNQKDIRNSARTNPDVSQNINDSQNILNQSNGNLERLSKVGRSQNINVNNEGMQTAIDKQNVDERSIINSQAQVVKNMLPLRTTSVDNIRLLRVNRRRNLGTLIKNEDNQLEQQQNLLRTLGKLTKNKMNREDSSQEDSEGNKSDISSNVDIEKQKNIISSEESQDTSSDDNLQIGNLRLPRSIVSPQAPKIRNFNLKEQRAGEIILTTIQQMLVRLKMERLVTILERKIETDVPLNRQKISMLLNQTELKIIDLIVKTKLRTLKATKNANFMEVIGEVLMVRENNIELNLLQFLALIVETANVESKFTRQLSGQLSLIMERVISVIDAYTDKLSSYNSEDLALEGVKLHDVKVDKLQTFFDTTDAALINLILERKEVELKNLRTVPVARQQRLNHKPFTLKFDISNEGRAPRPVVIRIFLGSKLDDAGRVISFENNRRNFLLLDAFTTVLPMGRITIKRKSTDITWTSSDTTPYMKIYKQVMLAVDGKLNLQLENLSADNCKFPQRLLLPRGLAQGLPMQLFAIVTPVTEEDAKLQREVEMIDTGICGMGTAAIKLDKLPLGFPLDKNINNSKYLLDRNAILKDILIYHQKDTGVKDI